VIFFGVITTPEEGEAPAANFAAMESPLLIRHVFIWVLGHTTQLLGTVLLIALPTAYLYWRTSIKRAIEKKLAFKVTRDEDLSKNAVWHKRAPLLQYLELDEAAVSSFTDISLVGLGDYMASLQTSGTFSLQRALISVMDRYGLRVALPLALFAPPKWRQESSVPNAFTGTPYAGVFLSNTISSLGLFTVSSLSQRYNTDIRKQVAAATAGDNGGPLAASQAGKSKQLCPVQLMASGSNPRKDGGLSERMTSPFCLPQHIRGAAGSDAVDAAKASFLPKAKAPEPTPIHPLFPDLALGNGGLHRMCSEAQGQVNAVMSSLFNRLTANALVGVYPSQALPLQPFEVEISRGAGAGPVTVTSIEDLVSELESAGHTVSMYITTNVTSFGIGLCVKERGEEEGAHAIGTVEGDDPPSSGVKTSNSNTWAQIPLAYPLSTGLYAQDGDGNTIDVVTLMVHSAIHIEVSGPMVNFALEWCLSVEGTTGWLPVNGISRPWQTSRQACPRHAESALATPEGRRAARHSARASRDVADAALLGRRWRERVLRE